VSDSIRGRIFGPNYRWWALWVPTFAIFLATSDSGFLSVSLPVIMAEFDAEVAVAGWILLIYTLVTGSLYLPGGKLADIAGRKKVFVAGFLLYTANSALAGFCQSAGQLIAFRAIQGIGSALMVGNTFAMVTELFPPKERGRALGISGGTSSALGFTLGPILGGFITHAFGWRYIFYVTAFLGLIGSLAALLILREEAPPEERKGEPFDFTGGAVFALGLSLLFLAMTSVQGGSWRSPLVWGEFLAALAVLAFFAWWESRFSHPLLDLRLFRIPDFVAGNVARFADFASAGMHTLMMPLFLQLTLGLDPFRAGLLMSPTPLMLAILSPLSGRLSERMDPRRLSGAGLALMGLSLVSIALLQQESGSLDVIARLALLGVGVGLYQTPNNHFLMNSIPRDRLGVASSFLSMIRSVGQSVGTAVATAVVSATLLALAGQTTLQELRSAAPVRGEPSLVAAFIQGYRYVYLIAALFCFCGAAASLAGGSRREGSKKNA
jgi:EmrB/QacA subfamily drug resistance transporter